MLPVEQARHTVSCYPPLVLSSACPGLGAHCTLGVGECSVHAQDLGLVRILGSGSAPHTRSMHDTHALLPAPGVHPGRDREDAPGRGQRCGVNCGARGAAPAARQLSRRAVRRQGGRALCAHDRLCFYMLYMAPGKCKGQHANSAVVLSAVKVGAFSCAHHLRLTCPHWK
jgi:hypothetical protein